MPHGVKVIEKEVTYDDGIKIRSWLVPIIVSALTGVAIAYGSYTALAATFSERIAANADQIKAVEQASKDSREVMWKNITSEREMTNAHEVIIAKQGVILENVVKNQEEQKANINKILDILLTQRRNV